MINLAGVHNADKTIATELLDANIGIVDHGELSKTEVASRLTGELYGWVFKRAWYYWTARGPALPFKYANPLQELIGTELRADGDCACRGPEFWYGKERKARVDAQRQKDIAAGVYEKLGIDPNEREDLPNGVPDYHIDTQEALNVFANVLRKWQRDIKFEEERKRRMEKVEA